MRICIIRRNKVILTVILLISYLIEIGYNENGLPHASYERNYEMVFDSLDQRDFRSTCSPGHSSAMYMYSDDQYPYPTMHSSNSNYYNNYNSNPNSNMNSGFFSSKSNVNSNSNMNSNSNLSMTSSSNSIMANSLANSMMTTHIIINPNPNSNSNPNPNLNSNSSCSPNPNLNSNSSFDFGLNSNSSISCWDFTDI